ncbi:hypothetical protein [Dethiothermospora halolimnae]|uniref:hypothetical protein n=1 Tax=Dethiothermospora halolimnae TaxID=3114390 RepID=UPI003CCC115A
MGIDAKIIDSYLEEKSLDKVKNHWIFHSISPSKYLFEEPLLEDYGLIKNTYKQIKKAFKTFKPLNLKLWESIFGQYEGIPKTVSIYLVVGCPDPYDAMIREDNNGNLSMIFDLAILSKYTKEPSKVYELILQMITHELTHVYINNDYKDKTKNLSVHEKMKYIMFDEGFAHFLSYKKEVLTIDWEDENLIRKKKKAYSTLDYEMNNFIGENEKDLLERSNSGPYWDKFGALSGLFIIADYYISHDKDYKSIGELYKKGYNYMWEYWEMMK